MKIKKTGTAYTNKPRGNQRKRAAVCDFFTAEGENGKKEAASALVFFLTYRYNNFVCGACMNKKEG